MQQINVSVVYAEPQYQEKVDLTCHAGTTIQQAIEISGIQDKILKKISDFNIAAYEVGVFGFRRDSDHVLEDNDRVEIYRPLLLSPTQARRLRAKSKNKRS